MSLVKFKNFYFRYKGNEEYALNNINLNIEKNKFILLAGETGSGKTTLLRCMNGLIPQFYSGHYRGKVEIKGNDSTQVNIADLSTIVGIVFQNPENQLVSMNVEHEIAFGMENLGFPRDKIRKKIEEVVQLTGIESIMDKAPFEISGGEQQRVAIASILALEPELLILDEPTANLDPLFAQNIINLLSSIQKKTNITIIISEHRMDLVVPIVDEIILMEKSRVVAQDKRDNIVNSDIFNKLHINKPIIYSIFKKLQTRNYYQGDIPISIPEALKILKNK
ncbi:MAG: ATP-binding cassette domain-containing protein [Candidatus Lokiarchaeota archaeon]|nr:ATP-binding cassette domain-containing protein [Candidatus Lokiarchaeota archaeon]MBD3199338.1 ATP-binding cassette domain-containing protein [Candidatus Lokiarchaeota archaeon]